MAALPKGKKRTFERAKLRVQVLTNRLKTKPDSLRIKRSLERAKERLESLKS